MSDGPERALDGLDATVGIVDGRLAMSADGGAAVRVDTPRLQPLSEGQVHATLKIAGDDYRAEVELDLPAIEALREGLATAPGIDAEPEPDA